MSLKSYNFTVQSLEYPLQKLNWGHADLKHTLSNSDLKILNY